MRKTFAAIGLFLASIVMVSVAHAAMVNVQYSGVITNVTNPSGLLNGSGITASGPSPSTFTGITSYDTTLIPSLGSAGGVGVRAFYSPVTVVITIDGLYDFSLGDTFIIDDFPAGSGPDRFWKSTAGASSDFAFPVPSGTFNVSLFDTQGTVFSDTSLPTSLNLNDFETRSLEIIGRNSGGTVQYSINGTIMALSATIVPIPAAFWLLGSGLIALIGIGRR